MDVKLFGGECGNTKEDKSSILKNKHFGGLCLFRLGRYSL